MHLYWHSTYKILKRIQENFSVYEEKFFLATVACPEGDGGEAGSNISIGLHFFKLTSLDKFLKNVT